MKRVFSLFLMTLVALLPMVVKAADDSINFTCGNLDSEGIRTCTVTYNIVNPSNADTAIVTLKEEGGADIITIIPAQDSDWTVDKTEENNGIWTVTLTSPGVIGEGNLFTFRYRASGTDDCRVLITGFNRTVSVDEPTNTDKPTDNKQTGATLPYIALGAIVLVATGAYIATRNKSKMYKI